jgi:hypothetical protein
MSARPLTALQRYLAETKVKMKERPEFSHATGLQLQDIALISWGSPGIDVQRKAALITEQAAALEEWMGHPTTGTTPAGKGPDASGRAPGAATSKQHSSALGKSLPADIFPAPKRRTSNLKLLFEYVEACGGLATRLTGWSAQRVAAGAGTYIAYTSPSGVVFRSRSLVARSLGLTPLNQVTMQTRYRI